MSQDRQKKQDAYAQMGDDYLSPVFDWVMGDIENEIYLGILQPWNETMEDVHLLNNGIRQNCPPEALFHVDPFTGASLHSSLATFDFAANFFKLPETRGGAALFAIPVAKTAFTGLKAVGKGAANAFKKVPIFDIRRSAFQSSGNQLPYSPEAIFLPKPQIIKHHVFNKFRGQSMKSEKYREFFGQHGIKVDDFCVELTSRFHIDKIHKAGNNWTTRWKQYIDLNPNATTKEVYQYAGHLMDEYGISHVPLRSYK